MKTAITVLSGLLLGMAWFGSATAQVAYTNGALNGCYAHRSTSLDNGAGASVREVIGTLCFDGNGHIVAASKAPFLSGNIANTNGTIHENNAITGAYKVTNSPGDGMGLIWQPCHVHAFVLHNVENGHAKGFSYMLIKKKRTCQDNGPDIIGGSATYQGPLH
jgi:hypothetical protein